jgi:hypothetical protein
MKTSSLLLTIIAASAGIATSGLAQLDTAKHVVHSTVRGTEDAAKTVAHGAKKAADTVADALTPDPDARRVDITVNDDNFSVPSEIEPGKTAFVVRNDGRSTQNFEVVGRHVDRKFVTPPNPGETRVLHTTLHRGTYTVYSVDKETGKRTRRTTFHVQ